MGRFGANTSAAVMQQRHEAADSLEDFPTAPWATRALCEELVRLGLLTPEMVAWEPCCNRGYMAKPLSEFFARVLATDIYDYGWPGQQAVSDFLLDWGQDHPACDWVIANPPFRLGREFILKALKVARHGVAMFVRTSFVEGQNRFQTVFEPHPEAYFMPFVERVVLWKGILLDPDVPIRRWNKKKQAWVVGKPTSATSYCWLVWVKGHNGLPQMIRIPPCRHRLTRPGDYPPLPDHLKPITEGLI
ncbi:MAG: methyltransferase [Rhodobacterales bacterium]|nr:MAG: methyltransferase [Rhodobacterales bacterium]